MIDKTQSTQEWTVTQQRMLVLVAGLTALTGLDSTIVNFALPHITVDLSASLSQQQWMVNSYNLLFGSTLVAAGVLTDRIGRRALIAGIIGFVVSSILVGLAQDPAELIAARGVQGLAAAVMAAGGLTELSTMFTGFQRAKAIGAVTSVAAVAYILGPPLIGLLVDGPGWRTAFFLNVPIGIAAVVLLRGLPIGRELRRRSLDVPGLSLLVVGLLAITYAGTSGPDQGILSAPVLLSLVLGLALLAGFVLVERRTRVPLVDLALFRHPAVSGGLAAVVLITAPFFGLGPFVNNWLQNILGYSAAESGLGLLSSIVPLILVAPLGAWLMNWLRPGVIVAIGAAVNIAGLALLSTSTDHSSLLVLGVAGLAIGAGSGVTQAPLVSAVLASVPGDRTGLASGLVQSARPLGTVAGVALLGGVLAGQVSSRLATAGGADAGSAGQVAQQVAAGRIPKTHSAVFDAAYTSGLDHAALISCVLVAVGGIIALWTLRDRPYGTSENQA